MTINGSTCIRNVSVEEIQAPIVNPLNPANKNS